MCPANNRTSLEERRVGEGRNLAEGVPAQVAGASMFRGQDRDKFVLDSCKGESGSGCPDIGVFGNPCRIGDVMMFSISVGEDGTDP